MEKDASPLDTLRQLKEWLDAGTITPLEFEALKKKLLFSDSAPPHPLPPEPALPAHSGAAVPLPPEPEDTPPAPATFYEPPVAPAPAYANVPPAAAFAEEEEETLAPAPAKSNALTTILIVGGILALLAVVVYLAMDNRTSERLTSVSRTAADTLAVQPEVGPQAEQLELPPVAAPETVRVVPAAPPVAAPADSVAPPAALPTAPVAEVPVPAPAPTSAPAATDESAVRIRVLQALTAYYDDLKAAPFNAAQHFAPAVERFYTLQNTTPTAINDDLTKSHFPEFTEEETQVVPGSLKIGPETEDGTRMVTYQEKSRAFRASRQQHQQTTAQVRLRLNRDYQITYLRQERLLENTFSE